MVRADNLEVEFALTSKTNLIGVTEYQLRTALPANMRGKLPTAKQLEEAIHRPLADQRASVFGV